MIELGMVDLIRYIDENGVTLLVNPEQVVCIVFYRGASTGDQWRATVTLTGETSLRITRREYDELLAYLMVGEQDRCLNCRGTYRECDQSGCGQRRPVGWRRLPGPEPAPTPPPPAPSATLSQDPGPGVPTPTPRPRIAPTVETDRYVVLLDCGHWGQTRVTNTTQWHCQEHGWRAPARDHDTTQAAVLDHWGYAILHPGEADPIELAGGGC